MGKTFFIKKAIDHLESALSSLQHLDFRNFASRFYYGYITILFLLDIKERGDWHNESSYSFPTENFKKLWTELKMWRNRADYEYGNGKRFSEHEKEFIEFVKRDLIPHLEDELIPFVNNSLEINKDLKLILIKKLEVVNKWLKILT